MFFEPDPFPEGRTSTNKNQGRIYGLIFHKVWPDIRGRVGPGTPLVSLGTFWRQRRQWSPLRPSPPEGKARPLRGSRVSSEMSQALAKCIAHLGHLQGGLHVRHVSLRARCVRDASNMQVRKWTCKPIWPIWALRCMLDVSRMHLACSPTWLTWRPPCNCPK